MRLAYSYIRFSTPDQKRGDSKRRQIEDCEEFCAAHKLVLEKSRQFYDEGKSAHTGKHRLDGALGKFLELAKGGRVPKGSVLIVEAFDRLSREDTVTAFTMFTSILDAGVDVVTLVDKQWYSGATFRKNLGQLYTSIGALWAANNFSELLSRRLTKAWENKRRLAVEQKRPMSRICPGWLQLNLKTQCFERIPERVKIVKLISWLTLRGWGRQRIAKLFNRHLEKVPTWGVKAKKASAWHYSYIQKVLANPAVLGQAVLYTTREIKGGGTRKQLGEPVEGYYPQVIDEKTFLRVQSRRDLPRRLGPVAENANNLFQGLLFDGDHPKSSMWFKNHGDPNGKWIYVVSDHRRLKPDEPIFSWSYPALERAVLRHLLGLDWSSLSAERNAERTRITHELDSTEAEMRNLAKQVKRLVELAKTAGDIPEIGQEMRSLRSRREDLLSRAVSLRQQIWSRRPFQNEQLAGLIFALAGENKLPNGRAKLREVIRAQVSRIELFRKLPAEAKKGVKLPVHKPGPRLSAFLFARCFRIIFNCGHSLWVVKDEYGWEEDSWLSFVEPQVPFLLLQMLALEDQVEGQF